MRAGGRELVREAGRERRCALTARADPLACRAERHEGTVRVAGAAGELREAPIDCLALDPQRLQPSLCLDGGRSLDRGDEGLTVTGTLGGMPALGCSGPGRRTRLLGGKLERAHCLVGPGALRTFGLGEIVAQPRGEGGGGLRANRETLSGTLQAIEGAQRGLARSGRTRELRLRALPVAEDGREPLLGRPPGERGRGAALLGSGPALVERREVDSRDPRPKRHDLPREPLRPLRGGRLQRERPEALAHLLLDVARALHLRRDPRELELGAVASPLELAEARSLLDESAPVLGLEASTASTFPCETIECIEPPSPTSASSSTRSVLRTGARLTRYWPSPPRTSRREIESSAKSSSSPKPPSSLSKTSSTSQWSAADRSAPPANSTSSGLSARSSDGVNDPAAQTIASETFDFPEPFGPTTTATPGSRLTSTGSGNDLKPRSLMLRRCMRGRG